MKKRKNRFAGRCKRCNICEHNEHGVCVLVNMLIDHMPIGERQARICCAYEPRRLKRND